MVEDPNILNNINVNLRNVKTEQDGTAAEEGIRSTLSRAHGFDPKDDNDKRSPGSGLKLRLASGAWRGFD